MELGVMKRETALTVLLVHTKMTKEKPPVRIAEKIIMGLHCTINTNNNGGQYRIQNVNHVQLILIKQQGV